MEEEHLHYHGVDLAERHIGFDRILGEFLSMIRPVTQEDVEVLSSFHRFLCKSVLSPVNVPFRARSTRDGYAIGLRKRSEPGSKFRIVGEVRIGGLPHISIKNSEAVRIATGAFLPRGSNAVLMKEYSRISNGSLSANRPIEKGENILKVGEDIARGTVVLKKGIRIEAHNISLLTQLGIKQVKVFRKPKIAFFSTGDELRDIRKKKSVHSIFDSNRPFIQSMVSELGALPVDLGIAKDNYSMIREKMIVGLSSCDALILSAGSSVGERDYVFRAADSIEGVRFMTHGIAMRPSSPTGLALYKGRPFVLLPGFPTSAIVSFFAFVIPAILKLSGSSSWSLPGIRAKMLDGFEGKRGLTHFVRVRVNSKNGDYFASIVRPTEASYSSWMGEANGLAVIGEKSSPVLPGDFVDVYLFGHLGV